jgi:hypothetical protein
LLPVSPLYPEGGKQTEESKFNQLEMTIKAGDGQLTEQEYEDKIEEAFVQSGIDREDID